MSRFLPQSRRTWAYLVCAVIVFLVLDLLALSGSEFALGILLTLAGAVIGSVAAIVVVYPFTRRLGANSFVRYIWFFGGIASLFLIVVIGSAIAGIPLYPTAEGGRISIFLYGLAFGFGSSTANFALGGGIKTAFVGLTADDSHTRQVAFRTGITIGLTVVGLITLCLLGFFFLEFVLSPIVRSLAS